MNQLNYFSGVVGAPYYGFISERATYVERFGNCWLPDPDRFAWLNPYTGNQHNRAMFTHLVISAVAARLQTYNDTVPRLIEPFVGSGQIFLNACHHGAEFNRGRRLFDVVIGGDLNHYLTAAYSAMQRMREEFVAQYKAFAKERDKALSSDTYQELREWTDAHGLGAALGHDLDGHREAAFAYIYLVNRCQRGSKLNARGGVVANLDLVKATRLDTIQNAEVSSLTSCVEVLRSVRCSFGYRDFADTCGLAGSTDLVVMDCPFPKFSYVVPRIFPAEWDELLQGVGSAGTSGTGDDGKGLQLQIVEKIRALTLQGTTVVVCNFANPALVEAYRRLISRPEDTKRSYVFTYKSPSTTSEAYQLAVIPGQGVDLDLTMVEIAGIWRRWGGFG